MGLISLFASKFLSLDIGVYNTKMVQISVWGKKAKVTKSIMFSTPNGAIEDGRIADVDALSDRIKKHITLNGFTAKETVITISGTSIITREITLPKVSRKELDNIIEMESPQSFPVDLANYLLDYKILEELNTEEGVKYRILMIAAPLNIIDGYVELITKCGLNLYSIDYIGNSIVKFISNEILKSNREIDALKAKTLLQNDAFKYMLDRNMSILKFVNNETLQGGQSKYLTHNDSVAVIDIGAKTTTVTIVANGTMQFSRMLLYGGEKITEAISEFLDISFEQAEEKKKKYGIILDVDEKDWDEEELLINESIRRAFSSFIDDITHFFDFYNSRGQGNWIDHIYLVGGGALLKGIDEYIENIFNAKTEVLNKFNSVSYSKRCFKVGSNQIFFPNCIGAVVSVRR